MASTSPWTWDPVRRSYYIYDQTTQLYSYQDGSFVDHSGRVVQSPEAAAVSTSPVEEEQIDTVPGIGTQLSNLSLGNDNSTPRSFGHPFDPSHISQESETPTYESLQQYDASSTYTTSPLQNSNIALSYEYNLDTVAANVGPVIPVDTPKFVNPTKERPGWKSQPKEFFINGRVFEAYCERDTENKKKRSDAKLMRLLVVGSPHANRFEYLCIPILDRDGKEYKSSNYSKRQYAIVHTVRKPSSRDKGRRSRHDHDEPEKDKKGFMKFHLVPSEERDLRKEFWIDFGQTFQFDDSTVLIRDFGKIDSCCKTELVHRWEKLWVKLLEKLPKNNREIPSDLEDYDKSMEPVSADGDFDSESDSEPLRPTITRPISPPVHQPIHMPPGIQCHGITCLVTLSNISQRFPTLKFRPRPEPIPPGTSDHRAWLKEYAQWGHLRCACGQGYFCREHGDWISGEEVDEGMAPSGDSQKNGSCPKSHYGDWSKRESYVGRRDAYL